MFCAQLAKQTSRKVIFFFESFRLKEFLKIMLCSVKSCTGLNVLECVLKFMKFRVLNKMHFCSCWILVVRIIYVRPVLLAQLVGVIIPPLEGTGMICGVFYCMRPSLILLLSRLMPAGRKSGLGSSLRQEMNLGERENKRIHELKRDSY